MLDPQMLLVLVLHEKVAQFLGVAVDEEADLVHDGEPDVFGPDGEVVVLVVGGARGLDEAVVRGGDITVLDILEAE